jgi:hypothetical protein
MSAPNPRSILGALHALVDSGATAEALQRQPALLELEYFVARATGEGADQIESLELAHRCRVILREIASDLDQDERDPLLGAGQAVKWLLGLAQGSGNAPWKRRRAKAAEALAVQPDTLTHANRARIDAVLREFAQAIEDRCSEYRLAKLQRELRHSRQPQESALRIPWLELFQAYYRVWNVVTGLEADVRIAILASTKGHDDDRETFALSSLHFYARFLCSLQDFQQQYGGLWLLPDVRAEQTAADAVWHITSRSPFRGLHDSQLRTTLANSSSELSAFANQVSQDQELTALLATWKSWLAECDDRCGDAGTCRPHQLLRACLSYISSIDAGWDSLSDWYQVQRPDTTVDYQRFHDLFRAHSADGKAEAE